MITYTAVNEWFVPKTLDSPAVVLALLSFWYFLVARPANVLCAVYNKLVLCVDNHIFKNVIQCNTWSRFIVQFDHNIQAGALIIDVESPLNFWLIIEAYDKVGHQLEQVLPQAQEEVQVEVTDIYLAVYPWVVHITHTLKTVDVVDTEASVHTRVGGTFIHILLTPGRKSKRERRINNIKDHVKHICRKSGLARGIEQSQANCQ